MSLERIIEALVGLGLSQTDAEVYVHLATKGPDTARNISDSLSINRRQIYRSLKRLQNKDIVMISSEVPSEFSAVVFEDVLNRLIKQKEEQAQEIRKRKNELVHNWEDPNK